MKKLEPFYTHPLISYITHNLHMTPSTVNTLKNTKLVIKR